jgi:hypothetical protein
MYTHTGRKGLYSRDSIEVDPVLNRNRKWHAVVKDDAPSTYGYVSYTTVCGVGLAVPLDQESAWGDVVVPRDDHSRISCKRCKKALA